MLLLSGEAANTNFIVFTLTRSGLEPTIYNTWGEDANHYTADAVALKSSTAEKHKDWQQIDQLHHGWIGSLHDHEKDL